MFRYDEFLLESQLDLISESIVYFSPNLRKLFNRLSNDNQIANDLVNLELQNLKDDITFIDFDKDPGYITFTTSKNARKNLNIKYPEDKKPHLYPMFEDEPMKNLSNNLYDLGNEIWTKSRSPLRIGRFLNKVFPGKFTQTQIEEFVNKFKSALENKGERIILVKESDIAFWYNKRNYWSQDYTLGNSCMKNASDTYFDIYVNNPDKCQMLCLIEEDENDGKEKLKGRALVWKVNTAEFEYFMDRQYAIDDLVIQKMKDYAISQGWAFKTNNSHSDPSNVTFNGKNQKYGLVIEIKKEKYGRYPYMDTFKRYNPFNGNLHNDDDESDHRGQYILEDTGGGYEEITDEETNYSEYYDTDIPEDEAIWSEPLEDYLWRNRAINVTRGSRSNRGWYPEDHDSIVFSEWEDGYLYRDDATYSEQYDDYISEDDAISVVHSINKKTGECNSDYYPIHQDDKDYVSFQKINDLIWYQNIVKKNSNWEDHSGILISLLTKDSEGDWIISKFKIELHKMKEPIDFVNKNKEVITFGWIHEMDAKLLDIEIEDETKISESWSYTEDLKEANLIYRLKKSITSSINSKNQLTLSFGEEYDKLEFAEKLSRIDNLNHRLEQLTYFLV